MGESDPAAPTSRRSCTILCTKPARIGRTAPNGSRPGRPCPPSIGRHLRRDATPVEDPVDTDGHVILRHKIATRPRTARPQLTSCFRPGIPTPPKPVEPNDSAIQGLSTAPSELFRPGMRKIGCASFAGRARHNRISVHLIAASPRHISPRPRPAPFGRHGAFVQRVAGNRFGLEGPRAGGFRIAPRLAGGHVGVSAMPRAFRHLVTRQKI